MSLTTTRTASVSGVQDTGRDGLAAGAVPARPPDLSAAVSQAREGDEDAFRVLYTDIQPRLLRYLRALVGTDAEDVASETWLQVSRDLRSFCGDSARFRGWVTTIARHRATDHLRALGSRPRSARVRPVELDTWAARDNTENQALESMSTSEAIALIARLPRHQAEAVMLHVVVGLDAPEAARILGKRPGAVRTACYRGLRTLSAMLTSATTLGMSPVPIARLLGAATAPARAGELTRAEQAVAAFQAHLPPARTAPGPAPFSSAVNAMTTKLLVVAALLVAGGMTATVAVLTGAGPASGSAGGHAWAATSAANSVLAGTHVPAAARRSGSVSRSARPGANSLTGACQSLAASVVTAISGPANAGSRVLTDADLGQALASPMVDTILVNQASPLLATVAGGDANVPSLCTVVLKLPTLAVAAARLPGSVLARLPVSTLVHLPTAVLAKLPLSVLRQLPRAVLRGLPASVLGKLPASGSSGLGDPARSRLAGSAPGQLPSAPGNGGGGGRGSPAPHRGPGNPVRRVVKVVRGLGGIVRRLAPSAGHIPGRL